MSVSGLVFLLLFCSGCMLAFARHPIYGLITYVAVFYLHPPSRWWGASLPDLRWSLLAAVITLFALLSKRQQTVRSPSSSSTVIYALLVFVAWLALQYLWALDEDMQTVLLVAFTKYTLLAWLITKCLDTESHVKLFLWTHVLGCLYLGWIAFSTYRGGRFEGFGGPDINEANAGALQIVTGIFVASALFLAGKWREKLVLVAIMPLVVNALVTTISRSAFLGAAVGGLLFNVLTPKKFRFRVVVLSGIALALFVMLTNPVYWQRVSSINELGQEVENVDTGASRLVLIQTQWEMFKLYPMGCGHRCTAVLSTTFLDDEHLTGKGAERARSSHNTMMTLLVEQGFPGIVLYFLFVLWFAIGILRLRSHYHTKDGFIPTLVPGLGAAILAIIVGDLFVDYLKMEVRIWFIAVLAALLRIAAKPIQATTSGALHPKQSSTSPMQPLSGS